MKEPLHQENIAAGGGQWWKKYPLGQIHVQAVSPLGVIAPIPAPPGTV